MIVEQRTYDFYPGKIPVFFKVYEDTGARDLQTRILGHMVGYFMSELGALNQTVHMWAYSSLDDRAARRATLMKEPVWQEFLAQASPLILRQESKILLPAPFSPIPVGHADSA